MRKDHLADDGYEHELGFSFGDTGAGVLDLDKFYKMLKEKGASTGASGTIILGKQNIAAAGGLTLVEAHFLLEKHYPNSNWMLWEAEFTHPTASRALNWFVCNDIKEEYNSGKVKDWEWRRVESFYPSTMIWNGGHTADNRGYWWTGIVEVKGSKGSFLLFSYFNADGSIGETFWVSTYDTELLRAFIDDIESLWQKKDSIHVDVWGGRSFELPVTSGEKIFLPGGLREDIFTQVETFFEKKDLYRELCIPWKRGFLLVGVPGCGKTMFIRQLIRHCYKKYNAQPMMLEIDPSVKMMDLSDMLAAASESGNLSLVAIEDIDSLTKDTHITRAGFLNQLDGVRPRDGLLIIGTTNNPGEVDPALVHRPSRFDRVWHFPLPNQDLRLKYLKWAFPKVLEKDRSNLVASTSDWSFAYLNELRLAAAMTAIQAGDEEVYLKYVQSAIGPLLEQFKAGEKGHDTQEKERKTGFSV